jgi:hypothetical protein
MLYMLIEALDLWFVYTYVYPVYGLLWSIAAFVAFNMWAFLGFVAFNFLGAGDNREPRSCSIMMIGLVPASLFILIGWLGLRYLVYGNGT